MLRKTMKIIDQKGIITKAIIMALASLFLFANKVSADWVMPAQPTGVNISLTDVIEDLTNWVLGFISMIAVLAIVWGGITYIGSTGDEAKATTGKHIITYAILGLVVAGIAYALVNVIVTTIL